VFAGADIPDATFVMNEDVKDGYEFFGALVVPDGDFEFRGRLLQLLVGLNHDPDLAEA